MKHLSPPVREKTIESANAQLAEGRLAGPAIRIAIARANVSARLERLRQPEKSP